MISPRCMEIFLSREIQEHVLCNKDFLEKVPHVVVIVEGNPGILDGELLVEHEIGSILKIGKCEVSKCCGSGDGFQFRFKL